MHSWKTRAWPHLLPFLPPSASQLTARALHLFISGGCQESDLGKQGLGQCGVLAPWVSQEGAFHTVHRSMLNPLLVWSGGMRGFHPLSFCDVKCTTHRNSAFRMYLVSTGLGEPFKSLTLPRAQSKENSPRALRTPSTLGVNLILGWTKGRRV